MIEPDARIHPKVLNICIPYDMPTTVDHVQHEKMNAIWTYAL